MNPDYVTPNPDEEEEVEPRGFYEIWDEFGKSENLNERRIAIIMGELSDYKVIRRAFEAISDYADGEIEDEAQKFFDALKVALDKFDTETTR